jgi:hypothetical protein
MTVEDESSDNAPPKKKTTNHSLPKHLSSMRNLDLNAPANETTSGLGEMLGLSFEKAIGYVGLPRTVTTFEDLPITAAIGPYGPYLKFNNSFASLRPDVGDVLTIDAETAEQVVIDGIINKTSSEFSIVHAISIMLCIDFLRFTK